MSSIPEDAMTMPPYIVSCIRYLSYWFLAVGIIATVVGCTMYNIFSSVLAYIGVTFLMCALFFLFAARGFSHDQTRKDVTIQDGGCDGGGVYDQLAPTAANGNTCSVLEHERLTQTLREELNQHLALSNHSGNCLVINICRNGFTSLDVIRPLTSNQPIRSYAFKFIEVNNQYLDVNETQNGLMQRIFPYLRAICEENQYRNGRAYVIDDGTLCLKLWPSKINGDDPPDYYDIMNNEDLPSYRDVTVITMKDTTSPLSTVV